MVGDTDQVSHQRTQHKMTSLHLTLGSYLGNMFIPNSKHLFFSQHLLSTISKSKGVLRGGGGGGEGRDFVFFKLKLHCYSRVRKHWSDCNYTVTAGLGNIGQIVIICL